MSRTTPLNETAARDGTLPRQAAPAWGNVDGQMALSRSRRMVLLNPCRTHAWHVLCTCPAQRTLHYRGVKGTRACTYTGSPVSELPPGINLSTRRHGHARPPPPRRVGAAVPNVLHRGRRGHPDAAAPPRRRRRLVARRRAGATVHLHLHHHGPGRGPRRPWRLRRRRRPWPASLRWRRGGRLVGCVDGRRAGGVEWGWVFGVGGRWWCASHGIDGRPAFCLRPPPPPPHVRACTPGKAGGSCCRASLPCFSVSWGVLHPTLSLSRCSVCGCLDCNLAQFQPRRACACMYDYVPHACMHAVT